MEWEFAHEVTSFGMECDLPICYQTQKFPHEFSNSGWNGSFPHKQFAHKICSFFAHEFYSSEWNGSLPISNLPTNFLLAHKFGFIILSIVQFAHKVFFFLPMSFTVQNGMGICP